MSNASTEKTAQLRARLHASGMRPIEIWVPDTRAFDYADRIKRQCRALQNASDEVAVLAFTEAAASGIKGWEWFVDSQSLT